MKFVSAMLDLYLNWHWRSEWKRLLERQLLIRKSNCLSACQTEKEGHAGFSLSDLKHSSLDFVLPLRTTHIWFTPPDIYLTSSRNYSCLSITGWGERGVSFREQPHSLRLDIYIFISFRGHTQWHLVAPISHLDERWQSSQYKHQWIIQRVQHPTLSLRWRYSADLCICSGHVLALFWLWSVPILALIYSERDFSAQLLHSHYFK